jgi:excisionase family DNA binding protein
MQPLDTAAADPLLTTQEVADALRVSTATVLRKHESGELPAIVLGPRTLRWRRSAVAEMLAGAAPSSEVQDQEQDA